jgi:hypothetical protein
MNEVLRVCLRTWKELGVPRVAREEMAAELEADLAEAAEAGVAADVYIGGAPRDVAVAWARERGLVRPRLRLVLTGAAAVVGAVPGAAFGLFAAYGLSSPAIGQMFGDEVRVGPASYEMYYEPPGWLILALYALGAAFAYAGALAAVRAVLTWRHDPAAGSTVRALTAWLPLVVLGTIAATITFSWLLGHSTSARVVVADVVVAAAALAFGAALVRALSVRAARARVGHGGRVGSVATES